MSTDLVVLSSFELDAPGQHDDLPRCTTRQPLRFAASEGTHASDAGYGTTDGRGEWAAAGQQGLRSRRHLALVSHAGRRILAEPLEAPPDAYRLPVCKRALDLLGASLLLLVAAPIMAVVVLLLALSGPSVFFRQQRVGRGGDPFVVYKFRTMCPDAEAVLQRVLERDPALREEWGRNQKLKDDPRITPLGRFLRRSSIDELPQLLNVLAGQMSLVGPRPVLQDELARYGSCAPWYCAVKPGVTGLWQVSGRYSTGYARRVALDVHYVRSQSLLLDLQILARTVYVVLFRIGAH